jgi:carbamoyl-phosphate synthase small subunit
MNNPTYRKASLVLEDGSIFEGKSFGFEASVAGEIVFNTAMTGYPESLTDPSYRGQIIVLTYPSIGNYGVPANTKQHELSEFFESDQIHAKGLIISDYSESYNHWNAAKSLGDWLKEEKIPALFGIDTRMLTKHIRNHGCMLAKIIFDEDLSFDDPGLRNLVSEVSTSEKIVYGQGKMKIMLVDCGVKNNIIRYLLQYDTTVIRVAWDYRFQDEEFDGLFISNGPGDPVQCRQTIDNLKEALKKEYPIFGICLGHQLLAIASGATTYKLKFGHRSHNQPVIQVGTPHAYLTSQNHGYAVDNASIPPEWNAYFTNLNDNSNEGLQHKDKPWFTTQFHPEASSGPTDTSFLFGEFIGAIERYKGKKVLWE